MTSPSISSTSRMTPCAAGCCGPKFIVKFRICGAPASSSPDLRPVAARSGGRSCRAPGGRRLVRAGGLLITRQNLVHALPGGDEIEAAKFLLQPDRLVNHPLLVVVVSQFDKAGQWEILAQGMPFETVIRQDAAQIRVIAEKDAEQVPGIALPPAGRPVESRCRGHRLLLIGFERQPDALIVGEAKQIVDNIEALWPVGIVDAANIAEDAEPAFRVVAQKAQHFEHCFALDAAG